MKIHRPGRARPPGRTAGLVGTLLVHGSAVAFLGATVQPPRPTPPAYAVELVAAPAPKPAAAPPKPAPAPERPPPPPPEKPAPVKPQPPKPAKTPPAPTPKPPPEPEREPPPPTPQPPAEPAEPDPEAPPAETATETPAPGETPSTGNDVATVKTPGLEFPYPEYLRNIVNEIYRRWDRSAARQTLSAEVTFLIMQDGSVRDIRFVQRSGNFAFDLNAQGAVEAAGNARAFGPLPEGWPAEVLPVSLNFKPTPR